MPIMRFLSALLLCLCASLPAGARPGSASAAGVARASVPASAIGSVKAAEALRAEAVAKRDVNALRRLIGGEYYHVETNGRVRSKTEFLQQVGRDEYEFHSYAVDDMEIRLAADGRSAIVTGRQVARTRADGRPEQWRGRYLRIWVRDGDGWRNTLHQGTEIRNNTALASHAGL